MKNNRNKYPRQIPKLLVIEMIRNREAKSNILMSMWGEKNTKRFTDKAKTRVFKLNETRMRQQTKNGTFER